MRKIVFLLLLAGGAADARAQTHAQAPPQMQDPAPVLQATIEDCHLWTRANHPLAGQWELIERTEGYNLSNAARGWLPQVTLSAQASYQSDVTSLPFDPAQLGIAGVSIPAMSRDQYGAKVELSQMVWDGGAVGARREGVKAAAGVERAATEVNLYALGERVNGLFFGILLAGEQLERLALLESDLETNLSRIEAYVRGGIARQADIDAIRIEQLKAAQRKVNLNATRRAYIGMLSQLTGRELSAETLFVKPSGRNTGGRLGHAETVDRGGNAINRPELALFDAQIDNIMARKSRLDAAVMPHLGLFATGGYGKPGLNMLRGEFEGYYIVGARLSWNIGGLYTRKNDRRQLLTDIRGVETRREAFLLTTRTDIIQRTSELERYREQLRYDDEIIALRTSVLRSSEAQMAGGTLSGSDLARDINALEAARQDKILHEMELLAAIYNLKFATNN